jgi:tetratricopeptide (TPR) repeat protein|tara:strand:- start:3426 stop:3956 length:531 start_codon:yes stop_codon:yes gene_type:complete
MNKWILSLIATFALFSVIFINLNDNSASSIRTNTELDNVSNEEMEIVINDNPEIFPMRIALANRYFDDINYSKALPHFMYVAENSNDIELRSYSLAQIAWMVYESGSRDVAINYLNESLIINPNSLVSQSYLGVLYLQETNTQNKGLEIIRNLLLSEKLSLDDKSFLEGIIANYEN